MRLIFCFSVLVLLTFHPAHAQISEMSSTTYAIQHSAVVGVGGHVASSSFSLQHQFGLSNMGRMESSRFVIGTAVELHRVQDEKVPDNFAMSQNYPNPFNQSTTFEYRVPQLSEIEIAVYSILGQRIATLVQGEQNAGRFTLKYDGLDGYSRPLPSGLYFCRMTSNKGFDKTIKFAILR